MQFTLQEKRENVRKREIYCLANTLAEKLFYEYYQGSEYVIDVYNNIDEDDEDRYIYQYFIVSEHFAERAIENGKFIIETQDLFIWRTKCFGMAMTQTAELDFMFS